MIGNFIQQTIKSSYTQFDIINNFKLCGENVANLIERMPSNRNMNRVIKK